MKIIKRNGSEAVFDITKIIAAITKANKVVPDAQRLTKQQIIEISDHVQEVCYARGHAMNVEEIQDIVEDAIMATGAYEVARRYITYRYVQSLKRTHNTTDDKILSLIECNNEEVKQENSNKNPTVNSVQRDYMAGEVSKDLTMRMLLPPEIVKAHEEGIIHFHDEILESLAPGYINGLSLLGGEPFEPENQRELLPFIKNVKVLYPNKTIWCYTGNNLEHEIWQPGPGRCEVTDEFLQYIDVLVDGDFVQDQYDISLRFRGSSNQRIIDMNKTRAAGRVVLWQDDPIFADHKM